MPLIELEGGLTKFERIGTHRTNLTESSTIRKISPCVRELQLKLNVVCLLNLVANAVILL